jgi:SAM-dependent methyltransferase/glycosyltransferase involved in cell wall biosynthesis
MLFPPHATDLLSLIPLSARTILDVECGTGTLAAAYRPMNPKARLLGIAADPVAAAQAALHMDDVATVDLERDPLPFDVPDGIDCIIYDDVLGHLRDPWALIRRHAEALSPDGIMLICVPNIEYWRLTERLLRGTWQGDETPKRDTPENETPKNETPKNETTEGGTPTGDPSAGKTQPGEVPRDALVRRFNLESVRDNLVRAGLSLCDVTMREPDGDAAARFAASLALGLEALGIDPREYAKRAAPSHLIWRVRKEPRRRMIVAGNMLDPIGGVSHVRVVYPIQALATDPTVAAGVTDRVEVAKPGDLTPRIFVLHRPALTGEQGLGLLQRLSEAGFLIVTEFDDLPEHFDMMRRGGALGFHGVHAVQTSTTAMADALRAYHSEIAVFPNAMGSLAEVRNFTDPKATTMFFGALNREWDWLPFMPVINTVAAIAGDRLRFQVVHDQAFFEALETPHKAFTPTCDYETYLRLLGGSEISFMPLSDTRFNRAKSDLKFIEAGSCRVAALASSVVYSDSIADGKTGLLFRDPTEFHAGLLRLLAMPELARDIADAARQYVADERMLAYQVAPRIAWYRSLWARREVLEDARRQRMVRYLAAA